MNKSCEYCQYNGPYGSIINPCENCPNNDFMINDTFPIVQPLRETTDHVTNKTYITATTGCRTNNNGAKINDVFATDLTTDLPTADEYRKSIGVPYDYQYEWSEPKYLCPKCEEGGMRRREDVVLASYPPKRLYKCDKCGHIDYQDG